MLKTGDFSKLSRVSVRMLRHYDDIGLLEAARQRLRAVTFLDGEYKETDVEVMAWKTVKGSYPVKRK